LLPLRRKTPCPCQARRLGTRKPTSSAWMSRCGLNQWLLEGRVRVSGRPAGRVVVSGLGGTDGFRPPAPYEYGRRGRAPLPAVSEGRGRPHGAMRWPGAVPTVSPRLTRRLRFSAPPGARTRHRISPQRDRVEGRACQCVPAGRLPPQVVRLRVGRLSRSESPFRACSTSTEPFTGAGTQGRPHPALPRTEHVLHHRIREQPAPVSGQERENAAKGPTTPPASASTSNSASAVPADVLA